MFLEKLNLSHPLCCVHYLQSGPTGPTAIPWRPSILPSELPDSYFSVAASMSLHKCLRCRWHSPHYYPGLYNLCCYLTAPWGCAMLPRGNSGLQKCLCLWTTTDLWQLIKPRSPCFQKGRAGQADFLRNPGNYLFFQYHSAQDFSGNELWWQFWTVNSGLWHIER